MLPRLPFSALQNRLDTSSDDAAGASRFDKSLGGWDLHLLPREQITTILKQLQGLRKNRRLSGIGGDHLQETHSLKRENQEVQETIEKILLMSERIQSPNLPYCPTIRVEGVSWLLICDEVQTAIAVWLKTRVCTLEATREQAAYLKAVDAGADL